MAGTANVSQEETSLAVTLESRIGAAVLVSAKEGDYVGAVE